MYPFSHVVSFEKLSSSYKSFLTSLKNIYILTTLSKALSNENWRQIINVEIKVLEKYKTWELVDLLVRKRIVGCKGIYTLKYIANKTLERYKAILVTKWCIQAYGVDYLETFALVTKMNIVRILLSLTTKYN